MKAKFTLEPLPLPFFTYYYKNLEQRSHPNSQYGYMLNEKGQFKNLLIQKEKKINEIKNNSSKCGQTKNIFQPLCEVLTLRLYTNPSLCSEAIALKERTATCIKNTNFSTNLSQIT